MITQRSPGQIVHGDGSVLVAESPKMRAPDSRRDVKEMVIALRSKRRRSLAGDWSGGVEGLPLQLLIMVVVAGLGLTIIMGWMNSISAPKSIGEIFVNPSEIIVHDDDNDGIYTAELLLMTVTVTDQGGNRLEGATVLLEGGNVRTSSGEPVRGVTDSRGQVAFADIRVEQFGTKLATITVTVAKGD
jgi:hypothetical protein